MLRKRPSRRTARMRAALKGCASSAACNCSSDCPATTGIDARGSKATTTADGVRPPLRYPLRSTIGCTAVNLAIEDHHLAVHAVERAEPETAVAEQFADRGIAVVAAGQQRGDRGHLVGLGGARSLRGGGEENERKRTPDHAAKH